MTLLERKAATEVPAGRARARVTAYNTLHLDGDVVRPGSLRNRHAAVSRWDHETRLGPVPLVGFARLEDEPDGLWATIEYFPGEDAACELVRDAEWSVAYRVVESHPPTEAERAEFGPQLQRVIVAWTIHEVSPVTTPASPDTGSGEVCCNGSCTTGGKACCSECETREALRREKIRFEYRRAMGNLDRAKRVLDAIDADREILERHEVPASQVAVGMRRAAEAAVKQAAEILGSDVPTIRWFDWIGALEIEAKGVCYQGTAEIWIAQRDDGSEEDVYRTGLHECFHFARGGDERAAKWFGDALSCLRRRDLRVGPRKSFEGRVVRRRLELAGCLAVMDDHLPGVRVGTLVADGGVVFERIDDDWRRVAELIPA